MHKETLTNKIRRRLGEKEVLDQEEIALKTMVPIKKTESKKVDKVELTPAERAQRETLPVRYHYAIMQRYADLNDTCSFKDFRKYLAEVWKEQRPWGSILSTCTSRRKS